MKLNMSRRKKISKWLASAGLFLCLLLTAVPVYADEPTTAATETTTTAETTAAEEKETKEPETAKAEEKETKTDKTAETETIPVGNLTLVDDVISAADAHREFLTVVSKDGSYFYIVIDRDSQGIGNVYFMNLVDNQDLYKLTGEKAQEVKEQETVVKPVQQQQENEVDTEQETQLSEEEAAKQKQKSLMITVACGAAIVIGVVIYVLKKRKTKKKSKTEFDLSDYDDNDE